MAEFKIGLFFVNLLGFSSYLWALMIIPWEGVKSWILFLTGLVFMILKIINYSLDVLKKNLILRNTDEIRYERDGFWNVVQIRPI